MSPDIQQSFSNSKAKPNKGLQAAMHAQMHVAIMGEEKLTDDFIYDYEPLDTLDTPVILTKQGITFFRAAGKKPEDQAAYFEAAHKAVELNTILLITGKDSPNNEIEFAAKMKSLMPKVTTIMVSSLSDINNILKSQAGEYMEDKAQSCGATFVATKDEAIFTSKSFIEPDAPPEKEKFNNIAPPENIDILLASTGPSEAFARYLDRPGKNPHAPSDQLEYALWACSLINAYESMPGINEAIRNLKKNNAYHGHGLTERAQDPR